LFGYIKPHQPELKVRELDAYKAVYCGMCGQLGKSYGAFARLSLSYDFTFLSVLHYAVSTHTPSLAPCRCPYNPLRKKRPMCRPDKVLEFSADVAAIMLYYKLRDNLQDSRGAWRLAWYALLPFAKRAWKRAAKALPLAEQAVSQSIARQNEVEKSSSAGVDAACEPSAAALSAICALLADGEGQRRVLARLGYLVGRFVYLCDALDDLEKDKRSGNYNPFLARAAALGQRGGEPELRMEARESLYMTIGEIAKTFELLDIHTFRPILENIVYLGFRATVDEILRKKEQAK